MLEPLTVEAMVEDWRKSIELLKRIDRSGITTTQREFEAWLATIDELRAEAERLRAALRKYGVHHRYCQRNNAGGVVCDCGYRSALAGTEANG